MKNLFIFLFVLLFTAFNSFAADVANDTVNVIEGDDYVLFYGIVQYSATDSTDNITTRAIMGSQLDWENSTLRMWGNAASGIDVNAFVLGGGDNDLTYMTNVYTQTAFDAAGAATPKVWYALKDTILTTRVTFIDPVAYERYKVLKFDGQADNPATATITWYWFVPKKERAPKRGAYIIVDTD